MPSRAERLHRLEAGVRAAAAARTAITKDQSDFDQRVAAIRACGRMPDGSPIDDEQEAAWVAGRGMVASIPGSAELFACTTMEDYRC